MNSFKYSYKTDEQDMILLNIYNSGYQKCESGYQVGPIVRNRFLIHHVVSGKGSYTVDGKTYSVNTGDTFIIYPGAVASYCADRQNPWEYYWVGFGGGDVKTLIAQTDFTPAHPVITLNQSEELKEILLKIYHCSGNELSNHVQMTGYLYLFLSVLIKHASGKTDSADVSLDYIRQAVDFISENYERPISVMEIADALRISRSYLYRIFMKHMGQSPKAYLENYRIKQACILLKKTSLSVNQIAGLVGYEDQLYFSKVFRKRMNLSPRIYRHAE